MRCCTMMTFLHVLSVPRNICSRQMLCQTARLHQYTLFKTCGWLPTHHIDFPNRLHLTSFRPRAGWSSWFNHSGAISGFEKRRANMTKNLSESVVVLLPPHQSKWAVARPITLSQLRYSLSAFIAAVLLVVFSLACLSESPGALPHQHLSKPLSNFPAELCSSFMLSRLTSNNPEAPAASFA